MRAAAALLLLLCACAPGPAHDATDGLLALTRVPGLDPVVADALAEAAERVRSAPDDAAVVGRLGMLCQANDLGPAALAAYARAAELDPGEPRWPYLSGVVHDRAGDPRAALAAYQQALAGSRTTHPPLHWRLGNAWLSAGELERAEESFRAAIDAAPEDHAGWFGLARVALQRDDPEAALQAVERGLALRPRAAYGRALRGDAYRRLGRWDDARRELEAAGDAAPLYLDPWTDELGALTEGSFQSRWMQASTMYEHVSIPRAIPLLEALHADFPDNPTVLKVLAEAYSRTSRAAEADEAFRLLLAWQPEDRQTLTAWIEHALRCGRHDVAREALDTLITANPEDGRAFFLEGALHEALDRPGAALTSYRTSFRHDQRNPGTRLSIGRLELELRRWDDARATFEAALAAGLENGEVWAGLARARLMLDDLEGARAALARARTRPDRDERALARLERALDRKEDG